MSENTIPIMLYTQTKSILKKEMSRIPWNIVIQTDYSISARGKALVIICLKKRNFNLEDFAVPVKCPGKIIENEKIDKYLNISRGLKKAFNYEDNSLNSCTWSLWYCPQMPGKVTREFGDQSQKWEDRNHWLLRSAKMLGSFMNICGDFCQNYFCEKPPVRTKKKPTKMNHKGNGDSNYNWCTLEISKLVKRHSTIGYMDSDLKKSRSPTNDLPCNWVNSYKKQVYQNEWWRGKLLCFRKTLKKGTILSNLRPIMHLPKIVKILTALISV